MVDDTLERRKESNLKSERAKARWAILRSALVSSKNTNGGENSAALNHSIHRFGGFHLLKRRIVSDIEVEEDFEVVEYTIATSLKNENEEEYYKEFQILTRERKKTKSQKQNLASLMSHVHHGVDNTGQTRVWDSANTLTYCLFSPLSKLESTSQESILQKINSLQEDGTLRVVELGAGMAGLPSFSLAAFQNIQNPSEGKHPISIQVTITDGHPEAIQNNQICASLTSELYKNHLVDLNKCITIQQLLWKHNEEGAKECSNLLKISGNKPYDLLLCSDCTHFQEFHAALAATIGRILRVGGIAILCQPHRGKSLTRFMNLILSIDGLFFMELSGECYNNKLYQKHIEYKKESNGIYDANIHYPFLLVLQKKREYHETLDTTAAVEHMKIRDAT